ncbi:hypothetical protein NN561_007265 [Cricetulus griseus]
MSHRPSTRVSSLAWVLCTQRGHHASVSQVNKNFLSQAKSKPNADEVPRSASTRPRLLTRTGRCTQAAPDRRTQRGRRLRYCNHESWLQAQHNRVNQYFQKTSEKPKGAPGSPPCAVHAEVQSSYPETEKIGLHSSLG